MADNENTPDDFISTVPINISELDPYKQTEEVDEKTSDLDKSLDDHLSALDDVLDFSSKLEDEEEAASALSESTDELEAEATSDEQLEAPIVEKILAEPELADLEAESLLDVDDLEESFDPEVDLDDQLGDPVIEEILAESELTDYDVEKDSLAEDVSEINTQPSQDTFVEETQLANADSTINDDKNEVSAELEEPLSSTTPVRVDKGEPFLDKASPEQKEIVGQSSSSDDENSTGTKTKAAILAACIGLVVGGGGLWFASSASEKVDVMQQELLSMEAQLKKYKHQLAAQEKSMQEIVLAQKVKFSQSVELEPKPKLKVEASPVEVVMPVKLVIVETPMKKAVDPTKPSGWVVNVLSDRSQKFAEDMKVKLQKLNIESIVTKSTVKGKVWFRVQITGFSSKELAKIYAQSFQKNQGIEGVWVGGTQ